MNDKIAELQEKVKQGHHWPLHNEQAQNEIVARLQAQLSEVTQLLEASSNNKDELSALIKLAKTTFDKYGFSENTFSPAKKRRLPQDEFHFITAYFKCIDQQTCELAEGIIEAEVPALEDFNIIHTNLRTLFSLNVYARIIKEKADVTSPSDFPVLDQENLGSGPSLGTFARIKSGPFEHHNYMQNIGVDPGEYATQKIRATIAAIEDKKSQLGLDENENVFHSCFVNAQGAGFAELSRLVTSLLSQGVKVSFEGKDVPFPPPEDLEHFEF